jgi:hypothetical protein
MARRLADLIPAFQPIAMSIWQNAVFLEPTDDDAGRNPELVGEQANVCR